MCRRMIFPALLLVLAGCKRSSVDGMINVGHVGVLSGSARRADDQAARGLRLALMDKDIAQVEGRPIQVRHTDTRGQIDAFESQAVRLVALSKVFAIYGGNTAEEVLRLDRARSTLLSPLGYRPGGASDQAYFLGLRPAFQGATLAKFAVDRLAYLPLLALSAGPFSFLSEHRPGYSAVVLQDERREQAQQSSEAFVETWNDAWAKRGESTMAKPSIMTFGKDANWQAMAGRLDEMRPTCLIFAGEPGDFQALLTHFSSAPMILYAGEDGSLRESPAGLQVFQATAFAPDAKEPAVEAFTKHFRESFKTEPDVHAVLAYDGARMLSSAMKKSLADGNSLAYELRGLKDFPAVTGPISFGPGQVAKRPAYVIASEGPIQTLQWRREAE